MSYQDRKDIDTLYDLIWDFDKNQTQFASREEFEQFKQFVKVNYSMSALTEAIASNMDENGLIIFENLQDGLSELETNLNGLENNLGDLTLQLNGDENNTGFIELLQQLQYNLYGEGETKPNGDPYTYEDPMSDSLKGLLDSFLVQLGELSAGDTKLSATLTSLSSKLQRFSGTIDDFRDSIDPTLLATLDPYMVDLIYEIASSNEAIYQHQNKIKETEDLIGKKTDSASTQEAQDKPVTLYGRINDTTVVASESNDSANGLLDLMYRGTDEDYDPDATPTSPADNTTLQWLGDTSRTANKVDGYVGDVSKFTESTISDALKNRADGQTAINNKIGNTTFTGNTLTGAIASLQTNIGVVNIGNLASTVGSINSNIGNTDVQSLANTVGNTSFTGASLTGAIASMQTQIGTVNINASVTDAIKSLQTSIGNVNILGGSSVSVALYDSILNIGDVNLFSEESISLAIKNAKGDIGIVDRDHGDISSQLYFLLKQFDDLYKANVVDEIDNNYRQLGYDYLFHSDDKEWYRWNTSQNKYVKITGEPVNLLNVLSTRLQPLLDLVYAQESHTHSKTDITDFNHTHTRSDISNFAHSHTKSDITDFSHSHGNITNDGKITTTPSLFNNQDYFVAVDNTTGVLSKQKMLSASSVYDNQASSYTNIGQLNQNTPQKTINNNINTALGNKQDTIPNFTVKTTQSMYGLTVTTYSDGLNVYLKISGTLNNSNDLPNGGNRSQIGTLQNTDYAPPSEMQSTVHSANAPNWSRMTVYSDGRIFFQNGASSKSYALECGFYYPLKSRIP